MAPNIVAPILKPHAVVIGSGFGGLAAAVRLGAKGYRVTVVEKLDAPGGRAYVFRKDGFTFDAGPTIITAPYLFEELWTLCGKKLSDDIDLRPMAPFYRIRFDNGETFDYSGDAETMRAEVAKFSPDDVKGFEDFMRASEEICRVGFIELGHVSFDSWTSMLKIAPKMIGLKSFRSVYQMVCQYIRDPRLRIVFSFHPLLVGGNPFTTTSIYSLIAYLERHWGVHFVMGGTGRLVEGLVNLIRGQGGEIRLNSEVRRIDHQNGKATGITLANGDRITADIVVSNADSAATYRHLLSDMKRRRWTDKRLKKTRFSMSLFVWYFGTRRRYPDVAHHTILLGPRYRELLDDIFSKSILAKDFSLYLHRPTATDTSLAPEGCDTFYVLSPVPHMESGIDWKVQAEPYRQAIELYLTNACMPGLKDEIVTSHLMTPMEFESRLNSVNGAAFGLQPVLLQSAWFRPHNKSEELENLYLVGAGTHPGAGVPGVLTSAKVIDGLIPHGSQFR